MATAEAIYWPLPLDQVTEWPGQRAKSYHVGTDFACPVGTPLPATSDGTIAYVGGDGLGGMTIDLRRGDGLIQRYGHLSEYRVRVGQRVTAGDIIALSGNTGYSTGPHLHWELRWDRAWSGGRWVDPRTLNPLSFKGDNDLTPEQAAKLDAIYAGVFGPKNVGSTELSWASLNGPQKAFYGSLEIDIHTQKLVAQGFAELRGQNAALLEAIKQLSGGSGNIDVKAIAEAAREAAEEGARSALGDLTLKVVK